jgi:hypothetical protein
MEFENTVNFACGFRSLLTVWVPPQELPQAADACEKGLGYLFTPCRKVSKGKREALPRKPLQEFGWVVAGRKGMSFLGEKSCSSAGFRLRGRRGAPGENRVSTSFTLVLHVFGRASWSMAFGAKTSLIRGKVFPKTD